MKFIAVVVPLLAASALFTLPLPSCETVFWLQAPMGIGAFATGIASIALLFLVAFCIQEKRPVPPLARWSLAGCLLSCFIGASTSSTFAPIHDLCIDRIQVEYGAQP